MLTLKLKRTKVTSTNVLSIEGVEEIDFIPDEGEAFLVELDTNVSDYEDTQEGAQDVNKFKKHWHALLFIGDGRQSIGEMYSKNKYTVLYNKVNTLMLEDKSVTREKLAEPCIENDNIYDHTIGKEKLDPNIKFPMENLDLQDISIAALSDDSLVNLNKLYNVKCDSISSSSEKVVNIDIPVSLVDPEDPNSNINIDNYLGLTLIVRFTYGNDSVDPPRLVVKTIDNSKTLLDFVMMVGDNAITPEYSYFNWQAHDSLVFTFTKLSDNNYSWQMAGTSASRVLGSWCYNNDVTYINGGSIYTGSIAANKIVGHSITADQIAIGALSADVLQPSFSNALNNLSTIEKQASSSRQIVATCSTPAGQNPKKVFLKGEDALAVSIKDNMPIPGTTLIVKFLYPNVLGTMGSTTTSLQLVLDSVSFPAGVGKGYSVVTYEDNESKDVKEDFLLNWTGTYNEDKLRDTSGNNIRTLIFNGSEWEVQPTNGDLLRAANWCLDHDQTYIQGGNIVTGRIYANQINAGSLNVGNINLFSTDNYGNTMAVLKTYIGSTGAKDTYGMMMAGSDEAHFRVIATNAGTMLTGGNGGQVFCWGGTTTDDSGNIIDSTGGRAGIYHSNVIYIGNRGINDSLTSELWLRAKDIYFVCDNINIKKPSANSWTNMWPH